MKNNDIIDMLKRKIRDTDREIKLLEESRYKDFHSEEEHSLSEEEEDLNDVEAEIANCIYTTKMKTNCTDVNVDNLYEIIVNSAKIGENDPEADEYRPDYKQIVEKMKDDYIRSKKGIDSVYACIEKVKPMLNDLKVTLFNIKNSIDEFRLKMPIWFHGKMVKLLKHDESFTKLYNDKISEQRQLMKTKLNLPGYSFSEFDLEMVRVQVFPTFESESMKRFDDMCTRFEENRLMLIHKKLFQLSDSIKKIKPLMEKVGSEVQYRNGMILSRFLAAVWRHQKELQIEEFVNKLCERCEHLVSKNRIRKTVRQELDMLIDNEEEEYDDASNELRAKIKEREKFLAELRKEIQELEEKLT